MANTRNLFQALVGGPILFLLLSIPVGPVAAQICVMPPPGLISWWDADSVSGPTAFDIVGVNNGTISGNVQIVAGFVGNAFSFDGSAGTRISGFLSNFAGGNSAITTAAWFLQPSASGHPGRGIVGVGSTLNRQHFFQRLGNRGPNPGAGDAAFWQGSPVLGGDGQNRLWLGADDGGLDRWWGSNAVIQNGVWNFVATTWNPTIGELRIYINGAFDRAVTLSNGLSLTTNFWIGGDNYNDNWFNGLIDEVQIFDRVLTSAEIQAEFDAGSAGKCKPGVTKELNSGPRVDDGGGTLVDLAGLITGTNDAGPIDIGRSDTQFYEFILKVTNTGSDGELDGRIVSDPIPDLYDLDPLCGDDPIAGSTSCDAVGGGTFVDRDSDTFADGIINDTPAKCTVSSTSGGSIKKGGAGLEPEFVTIVIDGLLAGETCTVRVFVRTDENPAKKTALFEPVACHYPDHGVYDTIPLNEGVKVFDPVTGDRLLGPVGSLQLTPNNCP